MRTLYETKERGKIQMSGKLIRLFLSEGKANGLRTAEISNMTIHATLFPRPKLDEFAKRELAIRPGVYLLLGTDIHNPEQPVLYVGEGDPVLPRLKSHANKKDFWTDAIVFTSKDNYLTKTQIQYLEAELYVLARDAFRVKLDNTQCPTKPNISEVDSAEVNQFMDGIKLILSSLGIDILESRTISDSTSRTTEKVYQLKNREALANMTIIENKYVVLKGSTAVLENRASVPPHIIKLRQELVDAGIMINKGDGVYTFIQDASFNSPSYAAAAIVGGAANGQKSWKYDGKSLKDIEKENIGTVDSND
jgi:hypothetical protein